MTTTTVQAREVTAALRKTVPAARTSAVAGHPGEFDVRLTETGHRDAGGPWALVSLLGRELGGTWGTDGVRWIAPRRGTDRAAITRLYRRATA